MKSFLKMIVANMLAIVARAVVHRYAPRIVMVTGSVGKSSTKDAIAAVLAKRFFVRKSEKNLNTEFGVPYTILGVKDPWGTFFGWVSVMKASLALLLLPNHYPNLLVLEVGADRPGDLARILSIANPVAVVVTRLPEVPVHVEAYSSPEAVREEEFSPAYSLKNGEPLILSADDPYALDSAVRTSARIISYGTSEDSMVRISDIGFYESGGKVAGMQATISMNGQQENLVVKGSVGTTHLFPAAAAVALAGAFDIPLPEALKALDGYEPPPGRGRLFAGIKGSIIIDDSYNASPVAVEEALSTLKSFPRAKRRIAVLGDMLELGRYSAIEHDRIGALAKDSADIVVAIGVRTRAFAAAKGKTEVMLFNTARAAAEALPALIRKDDAILVKGSQSMRTERVVEAMLAHPSDALFLVRQEREWKRKV
ncbi:MAG: UDP-N-acetylmuramoyl-tripeptide-D-alanyl-D-alanine ligase [Parcubacteria group bacterium GW2011_GWB1_57_6]|nr:MAG: UDP-N-acetylmuramoyl-tripeptide-D-alanyl-D-alanine ligase [Parcubacteria group bacterium GW2011_GWB1_57_6]